MENKNFIFKTMDNTPRMIFWGVDELVVMLVPFFVGLLWGGVLGVLMILSGPVLNKFFCRCKRRYPRGRIKHSLYWNLPTSVLVRFGALKRIPPSHVRGFFT